jgi:hypothetical protein
MATHEEPLPAWLEQELRAQALGPRPEPRQPKPPKREMSKPAYGRGEECPY